MIRSRPSLAAPPVLAPEQERLWLADRLAPSKGTWNVPLAWGLEGPLEVAALERALEAVLARHAVLRLRFEGGQRDGAPRAVLDPPPRVRLAVEEAADEDQVVERFSRAAAEPFDLARGPLWRVRLARLGPERHGLLAVFHHTVFDGRSGGVFWRDLVRAWSGEELAPLAPTYFELAAARRARAAGPAAEAELAWWREHLRGAPLQVALPGLPASAPPVAPGGGAGFTRRHPLDPGLARGLVELARAERTTLFQLGLTAAARELMDLGGRPELVLGTLVDGRDEPGAEELCGLFARPLPLRLDYRGCRDEAACLERTRSAFLTALEHREVDPGRLARELGAAPFFDLLFLLQEDPPDELAPPRLRVRPLDLEGRAARGALALWIHRRGDSMDLWAEAPAGGAEPARVETWLASIAARLERRVAPSGPSFAGEGPAAKRERPTGAVQHEPRTSDRGEMRDRPHGARASAMPPPIRTTDLLARLSQAGVRLELDGDELVVQGPREALTPELRDDLRAHKPALVALLAEGARNGALPAALPRAPRGTGPLPLSFGQERLWVLGRLEPDSCAYHMPLAWRLRGELDREALVRAFGRVVERHEILRTRYVHAQGRPGQVVEPAGSVPLVLEPGRFDEEGLRRELARRAREPFDLEARPPVRPALFRLGDDHVLFLLVHHIAFDGWSAERFLAELGQAYGAEREGREPGWDPLPVQFADWAHAQRELFAGGEYERLLTAWKGELAGGLPTLELPTDRPRPAVQSYRGANESRDLPAELVEGLRRLAREEGATSYMVLVAATQALLGRYANAEIVPLGTVVAGREHPDLDPCIGFFANTLVLRGDLSGDPSFRELLGRVKRSTSFALDHQGMPFERLVEELAPERDLSRTPLFQALVMIEDGAGRGARLGDVEARLFELETDVARTDLMITGHDAPEGFSLWAEYATDLFERATVARLLRHLEALLAAVVRDRDRPLSRIPLLDEAERARVLAQSRSSRPAAPFRSAVERFEEQVAARPDAPAAATAKPGGVVDGLSYGELDRLANGVAAALALRGIGRGDLVGLALERDARLPAVVLGVWKSGAAYVPLDPGFPGSRLRYMASDSGLELVLTGGARLPAGVGGEVLSLADVAPRKERPSLETAPSDRAYVIYTSGSTGRPKGVEVPHGALANFLASMVREPGIAEGETLLAVTTLSFDISVLELFAPLVAGGTTWIAPREVTQDGVQLARTLTACAPDLMQATPASWTLVLRGGWEGSPKLRLLAGGEPISRELADELLARGKELWNLYGPTETTVWSSVERVAPDGPITIGVPIDATQLYVLDRHMEPAPPGVCGELWIGGAGVTLGYLGRPELTAERFVPDPFAEPGSGARLYRTGDLARRRADGRLEHKGRVDAQVKLRGFRIEPGEIESVLAEDERVAECACVVHGEGADERLVLWMVLRDGAAGDDTFDPAALLRARLPAYMVPGVFRELDELPRTPNGKVDRLALARRPPGEGGGAAAQRGGRAPAAGAESDVAAVWGEVLGRETVPADVSFFELGGSSLSLVELQVRLQSALGRELTVVDLFQHPTVAAQAEFLGRAAEPGLHPNDTARGRMLSAGRRALMQRRRTRK